MRLALVALLLCACSADPAIEEDATNLGGPLDPAEVVDRYADAVCTHVAGCADVTYDSCIRDIDRATEWRFPLGWAQATTEAKLAECEAYIAGIECGVSIWRSGECDFGQSRF